MLLMQLSFGISLFSASAFRNVIASSLLIPFSIPPLLPPYYSIIHLFHSLFHHFYIPIRRSFTYSFLYATILTSLFVHQSPIQWLWFSYISFIIVSFENNCRRFLTYRNLNHLSAWPFVLDYGTRPDTACLPIFLLTGHLWLSHFPKPNPLGSFRHLEVTTTITIWCITIQHSWQLIRPIICYKRNSKWTNPLQHWLKCVPRVLMSGSTFGALFILHYRPGYLADAWEFVKY